MKKEKFSCDCCGLCCMNLKQSSLYEDLDQGNGICKFFEIESRLCAIYNNRPIKCNIEKCYELYFKNVMSKETYYKLNYKACRELKRRSHYALVNT